MAFYKHVNLVSGSVVYEYAGDVCMTGEDINEIGDKYVDQHSKWVPVDSMISAMMGYATYKFVGEIH